jgi:hypothetical protein
MNKDTFKFFLYRLNKELRSDLFCGFDRPKKTDNDWLEEYLKNICSDEFDFSKKTKKSVYTWAVRNYMRLSEEFSSLVLARSTVQRSSTIVTSNSLSSGESVSSPPPADTIILLIYWPRHIVVVENRSGMTTGETWLRNFHKIIENAKIKVPVPIAPRLEPIPLKGTILHHLKELDRVFRLRIRLTLPNPELNRWAQRIYDEMIEEKLDTYLQEFISSEGIRVDEGSKAHSSASLAELGYREGGVQIDGQKNGKPVQIDEGKIAIRGKIDQLRSLVRGLETNAGGKQLPNALNQIQNEIDRLFPDETLNQT